MSRQKPLPVPPPLVALATGAMIWGTTKLAPGLSISFAGQDVLAGMLIAIGLVFEGRAVASFFRAKTTISPLAPDNTKALVVKGLYRVSRNPMYLNMLVLLIGWSIWLGAVLAPLFWAFFVAWITHFQIKPEERALEEKFGDEYRAYCARVRRWI